MSSEFIRIRDQLQPKFRYLTTTDIQFKNYDNPNINSTGYLYLANPDYNTKKKKNNEHCSFSELFFFEAELEEIVGHLWAALAWEHKHRVARDRQGEVQTRRWNNALLVYLQHKIYYRWTLNCWMVFEQAVMQWVVHSQLDQTEN